MDNRGAILSHIGKSEVDERRCIKWPESPGSLALAAVSEVKEKGRRKDTARVKGLLAFLRNDSGRAGGDAYEVGLIRLCDIRYC